MWSVVGYDALQPRHPSRMRTRRASPSRFWSDQEKSGAYGTGSWTDMWVLQGNLQLLCGNHQEISELRNLGHSTAPRGRSPLINWLIFPHFCSVSVWILCSCEATVRRRL